MRKVEVVVDEEITAAVPGKWSCRTEVIFADGRRDGESVESARGDPRNPMTRDEVRGKFHPLTGGVLDRGVGDRICDYVDSFERQADVSELGSLLRGAGRTTVGSRLIPSRRR
jgi:2-methylcitrate dehydratase PrpD